jgi:hypothetical protein
MQRHSRDGVKMIFGNRREMPVIRRFGSKFRFGTGSGESRFESAKGANDMPTVNAPGGLENPNLALTKSKADDILSGDILRPHPNDLLRTEKQPDIPREAGVKQRHSQQSQCVSFAIFLCQLTEY